MTILDWFYLIILLIIGGYIYNRVIFFIGAFIWQWSSRIIFINEFWFDKGTSIKDIYNSIKYQDGDNHKGAYNEECYLTDSYGFVSSIRWFPVVNILISTIIFCANILGLILALLVLIIRFLIVILNFIWKYGLKYVCKGIKYLFNKILNFLYYIHLNSFIKYLFNICINIKDKILNFKIA